MYRFPVLQLVAFNTDFLRLFHVETFNVVKKFN